jgi:hypothetical protein
MKVGRSQVNGLSTAGLNHLGLSERAGAFGVCGCVFSDV